MTHYSILSKDILGGILLRLRRASSSRRISSVGTATGYGPDGWGSIPSRDKGIFSSPQRPGYL
jgi:hypothetical protein